MNSGFYNDLDTNFEEALKMTESKYSHEELLNLLKNGNIPQKQFAAMSIEKIDNKEEATILVNNLTGCDGKIREATALKINELKSEFFKDFPEIFANASIDINPNVCRLVIDTVAYYLQDESFVQIYSEKILEFIQSAFEEMDKFIFRDKKYVINKQLFKLYWSLEGLALIYNKIPYQDLVKIVELASKEKEYTIREKAAKLALKAKIQTVINKLKYDENYYVRSFFN